MEQRRATRAILKLRPGESVLDVGCGPGFLAAEMADEVGPRGRVVGIDVSPDMLALAREQCGRFGQIDIRDGDAIALPFADAMFDVVISTQVYEYVHDIAKALGEVTRVLRLGGRLLVVATDWESSVWANSDEARMARVLEAWREHGAESRLPRKLPKLLRDAGFKLDPVHAIPIINIEYDPNNYGYSMVQVMAKFAVGRQQLTQHDADAWAADLQARHERGEYFFSVNRYVFVARK